MTVFIRELAENSIDKLICQATDRLAKTVPSEESSNTVDVTINAVGSIVVTPETVTFIFENQWMFCAEITVDDYYKIEVI